MRIRRVRKNERKDSHDEIMFKDLGELEHLNYEEEDTKPRYRRVIVAIGSLLTIILLIGYFLLGYPIGNIIAGQIKSEKVEENILRTNDIEVVFLGNTLEETFSAWTETDLETVLCLHGWKNNNTYTVDYAYTPRISEQSYHYVRHAPCDEDTIIMFHTQPYKSCLASSTDLNTLEKVKTRNPEVIMLIMCEQDRFSVYR